MQFTSKFYLFHFPHKFEAFLNEMQKNLLISPKDTRYCLQEAEEQDDTLNWNWSAPSEKQLREDYRGVRQKFQNS